MTEAEAILEVKGLSTTFDTDEGSLTAVDDVSFTLRKGEVLGIVGESGCGKTVTSKSILRLIPQPPGRITAGSVHLGKLDLVTASENQMREIRGDRVAMIFQEPMTALNPVLRVGKQIEESLILHRPELDRAARKKRVVDLLERVGIPSPAARYSEYPHQLSGGMRQRVMIAMALACDPDVLIADEPTTALDVTIQAQVLRLMLELRDRLGTAIILITHDLGVVAEVCDRVVVMYAARVVEQGSVDDIFHRPSHPYTEALLRSIPRRGGSTGAPLETIPGLVPNLRQLPPGCRFADRCRHREDSCTETEPPLVALDRARSVRCFFPRNQPEEGEHGAA